MTGEEIRMINIERRDRIDIVTFSVTKINALVTDELREEISRLFDSSNSKVIIDLKGVEYIDSSGFGCFLSVLKRARGNYGALKFVNPEPGISKLFNALYLHTVFQIYNDIETGIRSFRQ
jgi:anti-sigma B factor antagonist